MYTAPDRLTWRARWAVIGVILVGVLLRLYHIGAKPVWFDEAFSVWMARHTVSEVWYWTWAIDLHTPLYYALLHFWMIFGDSEATIRLLSALFGIATIPLMYALGTIVGGHRLGIIASLLLASSPFHVQFGQEARMYTLLALAATFAMWGLASLLQRFPPLPTQLPGDNGGGGAQGGPVRTPTSSVAWLAYVVGAAVAVLSHNQGALVLVAANLVALGWWWTHRAHGRDFLRNWLVAQIAVLILWSIWLPKALDQASTISHAPSQDIVVQFGALRIGDILYAFQTLYGPSFVFLPFSMRVNYLTANLILLILAGAGILSWRQKPGWILFALALWLVAPAIEILVSVWRPVFLAKSLIWTSVPFYLVVAATVVSLRGRLPVVILAGLLAVNLLGIRHYDLYNQKSKVYRMAAYVASNAHPGDEILFYPNYEQPLFDYYFQRYGKTGIVEKGIPFDFPGPRPSRLLWRPRPRIPEDDLPRVRALASGYKRVWLVYGWAEADYEPFDLQRLERLTGSETFPGAGKVFLFEKK